MRAGILGGASIEDTRDARWSTRKLFVLATRAWWCDILARADTGRSWNSKCADAAAILCLWCSSWQKRATRERNDLSARSSNQTQRARTLLSLKPQRLLYSAGHPNIARAIYTVYISIYEKQTKWHAQFAQKQKCFKAYKSYALFASIYKMVLHPLLIKSNFCVFCDLHYS